MEKSYPSRTFRMKYLDVVLPRYRVASRAVKRGVLDEVCRVTGYTRKHAIARLNTPGPRPHPQPRQPRTPRYGPEVLRIVTAVWEAASYPWSVRLQAILRLWLPWIRRRFALTPAQEAQVLAISPRTLDRRLRSKKAALAKRRQCRTRPGTLLRREIPIQTTAGAVAEPGQGEVDTVAHCGPSASGDFVWSVNLTDLGATWVETRAVLGKGEVGVTAALDEIRAALPFRLTALHSDNGSEFINHHLLRYCRRHGIRFTRGRAYKKDDQAHIEQKNWTHVRKLIGYDRYDTPAAVAAFNALYAGPLRHFMNLFQPSVRLVRTVRRGARVHRIYDAPQTPLDRLLASGLGDRAALAALTALRDRTDPFALAQAVQRHLERLWRVSRRPAQARPARPAPAADLTRVEQDTLQILGRLFGTQAYVRSRTGALMPVGARYDS